MKSLFLMIGKPPSRRQEHRDEVCGFFRFCGRLVSCLKKNGAALSPVGSAMDVRLAVDVVGAGRSAHVDVRAARGALLRVIHRGIHAKFLNRFGSGRRQRLPDRQVGRSACSESGAAALLAAPLTPVLFTTRAEATWLVLLPLNKVLGIHAVQ